MCSAIVAWQATTRAASAYERLGPAVSSEAEQSHFEMSGSYLAAWRAMEVMPTHGQGMHWEVMRVFAYGLTCSQLCDADMSVGACDRRW